MLRIWVIIFEFGVCIFGVYYISVEFLKLGWMYWGKEVKCFKRVEVVYDLVIVDYIYIYYGFNSNDYFVC